MSLGLWSAKSSIQRAPGSSEDGRPRSWTIAALHEDLSESLSEKESPNPKINVLPLKNSGGQDMEGRNGDISKSETEESGSPSTSDPNGEWLSEKWPSREWLSRWEDRLPDRKWTIVNTFLVAVLVVGLSGGGYYWYQHAQEQERQERLRKIAQKLSTPIHWPASKITTLDATFQLATKWIPNETTSGSVDYKNGEMKYKLSIYGYPDVLKEAWGSKFNSAYFLTIQFLDADDFQVTSIKITLDKLTRTVNPKGEGIGFSVQGSETMSLRTYRRIEDWKITWNF